MTKQRLNSNVVYQLKITLQRLRPPVWRRVQVRPNLTLAELHDVVQVAMGWEDAHLHQFEVDGTSYGPLDFLEGLDIEDENKTRLSQVARVPGDKLSYCYDFGDDWEHLIEVEEILDPDPEVRYPVCTKGRRACPPEDCGGVGGYAQLLDILADPEHDEYEEMLDWVGGSIDPDKFDLDAVNQRLGSLVVGTR